MTKEDMLKNLDTLIKAMQARRSSNSSVSADIIVGSLHSARGALEKYEDPLEGEAYKEKYEKLAKAVNVAVLTLEDALETIRYDDSDHWIESVSHVIDELKREVQ